MGEGQTSVVTYGRPGAMFSVFSQWELWGVCVLFSIFLRHRFMIQPVLTLWDDYDHQCGCRNPNMAPLPEQLLENKQTKQKKKNKPQLLSG